MDNISYNESSLLEFDVDVAIVTEALFVGTAGIMINCLVLYLIFSTEDLRRKDYVFFIANRTIADSLLGLSLITLQPVSILVFVGERSGFCTLAGFAEVALASASMYAEPFLAFNRYISIEHGDLYKTLFVKKKVNLMCVAAWFLGLCSSVPHVVAENICRSPGLVCTTCLRRESLLVVVFSNFVLMFIGLGSVGYFNFKIYRALMKHKKQTLTISQQSKLHKDKEMLVFIAASAITPVVLESPVVVGAWIRMYRPDWVPNWIMLLAMMIFNLAPPTNAFMTLTMVRPIRREFQKRIQEWRGIQDEAAAPGVGRTIVTVKEAAVSAVAYPKDDH